MATIFTRTLTTNDTGWDSYSLRTVVPITGGALDQVRVTFAASSVGTWKVDNASIGISNTASAAASSNTNADSVTTATPVEILFTGAFAGSGGHGFTLTATNTLVSEWVNLTGFSSTNLLVVIQDVANTGGGTPRNLTGGPTVSVGGTAIWYLNATDSYNLTTGTGFSGLSGQVAGFSLIETQSASSGFKSRIYYDIMTGRKHV